MAGARKDEFDASLAEVDRRLAALSAAEVDAAWVAAALRDWARLWDAMTERNRVRLVHAIVREVTVNTDTGAVEVAMVDLAGAEMEAAS